MELDEADLEELPNGPHDRDTSLGLDEVFELLKNQRRRRVLRYLAEADDDRSTLSDLAEHVAGLENDVDPALLNSTQRKRTYVALYQTHLPKLDSYGVIDYDQNRGTVVLADTSQLEPYLAQVAADGDAATNEACADIESGTDSPMLADGGTSDDGDSTESDDDDGQRDLYVASATTAVVLVGLAGLGPLAAISSGFWTVISLSALLWLAIG